MTSAGGLVATSEIHAARAAADVLRDGGNAVDAAVCAAATLTVTEPTSNGLGGDLFALIWDGQAVAALASSGASPAALSRDKITAERVPLTGWLPVTVPGQVAGWEALQTRFGRLPLARCLLPAITLARAGFPVGRMTAAAWARAARVFADFPEWRRVFLPGGRAPAAGECFTNPDLAGSLATIAAGGARAFYGDLGTVIARHAAETGGLLTERDLLAHEARWETPLSLSYRGLQIVGMGAPTQGVVALQALGLLDGMPPSADESQEIHDQIEAIKLSFADAYATVADPDFLRISPTELLRASHLARRRAALDRDRAGPSPAPAGISSGTVLVCTADREGRLCSLIQSNFHGFGSGIVVPGTGIALQNRGAGFVLTPGHPNEVAGSKRPFHTILPALLFDAQNQRQAAFGCMGGQMQPQGHVQLVSALSRGRSPQQAVTAPRWRWLDEGPVALEQGFDPQIARSLAHRGHTLREGIERNQFGGAQIAMLTPDGPTGGSDPRKDGEVIVV